MHIRSDVDILLENLDRTAHLIRRLDLNVDSSLPYHLVSGFLLKALPHLNSLIMRDGCPQPIGWNDPINPVAMTGRLADVQGALASTTRLTHLSLSMSVYSVSVDNVWAVTVSSEKTANVSGRLPGQAWAAFASAGLAFLGGDVALDLANTVVSAAAPTARLTKVRGLAFQAARGMEDVPAFANLVHPSLTHLAIRTPVEGLPRLAALLDQLPQLADLVLTVDGVDGVDGIDEAMPDDGEVDLTTLNHVTRLTRLAVLANNACGVRLTDAVAAGVRDLTVLYLDSFIPPYWVAGHRFTNLTRLVYHYPYPEVRRDIAPMDLGVWSDAGFFCIPTLVELEVAADVFTLGGRHGHAWATGLARTSLPQLAKLALAFVQRNALPGHVRPLPRHKYTCRASAITLIDITSNYCLVCGEEGGCALGREARRAIFETLPEVYATEKERELRVCELFSDEGWHADRQNFAMEFEDAPPPG
jgi:hypothetical protein